VSGSYEILRNGLLRVFYNHISGDMNWEKIPDQRRACDRDEFIVQFCFNY